MHVGAALVSGLMGACALTVIHESARHALPHAPRVDAIGKRALKRSARALDVRPPHGQNLYLASLAGEVVSNSLYYALVALGGPRRALPVGALLGAAGGIGAITLPQPLGLGRQPEQKSPATELMTVAWYTLGGMAAGAAYARLSQDAD
jgi:hypothetical protein